MGITAIPFAVRVDAVRSIFGSKDRELLEKIKNTNLYGHYAEMDDLPKEYQFDFDQALEDIVFGYIPPAERKSAKDRFWGLVKGKPVTGLNEKIAHGYGYVLLVVCDLLGEHLLPHCDGFYGGSTFKAAAAILRQEGLSFDLQGIFEGEEVFDLPRITDFPAIKLYSRQAIDEVNAVMEKIDLDDLAAIEAYDDPDELRDMLGDIRDSFQACAERGVEMVVFTH
ncbi:DUF7691 family protein [Paraflavitalea pollutisoli]|uniref:DUF7691 family protein n=1 Tax=Paraflavitalea pollutisoli TaxID=3034143 RepID=UPI0023EDA7D8|nr:hypothetical protein [Paraflavitalea sp. H1-2-19X]